MEHIRDLLQDLEMAIELEDWENVREFKKQIKEAVDNL